MTILPPLAILAALVAALVLPLVLLGLSHGPWRVAPLGRRFHVAALLVLAGWGTTMLLHWATLSAVDLFAAFCLLAGALLAEFTLWTLVCWGFSITLLLELVRADRPLDRDAWIAAYTGGGTIEQFTHDRLGVLLHHGMARVDDGLLSPTPRGLVTARLDGLLRLWFGLRP